MRRRLAAGLAASYALTAAGAALAGAPPRPIVSAPSQYVEVVPSAGGGVPAGSSSGRSRSAVATGPRSALGAAADAVASADRGVVVLGAAMAAATAWLVATAIRHRRRSGPA